MSSPFFQIFRVGVVFFLSVYHWGALENAACGKFALRALAQSLAREYQPQGIHVAHIIVDGIISSTRYLTPPRTMEYLTENIFQKFQVKLNFLLL
jgi:NAD(P)-dependent dehydrogenase (short-subunit alcohol dehydrogenase family)